MMELMRQWLLGVSCTAMVLALAESLVPEGNVKKVCRLAGGLALLLAVVSPVIRMDGGVLSHALEEHQAMSRQYEKILEEKNVLLYQTIIEDGAAAYIVDKAEEIGISCQAEVTFLYDEDGIPSPWEVTARGGWTEEQRIRLEQLVEDGLGIPAQRQYYEEIEP